VRQVLRRLIARKAAAGLLALCAACACPAPAHGGVQVAILPASQTVAPGSEFEVTLQVTSAGSAFNGFTMYVGYDPAVLTPVPLSPISSQPGVLVTSACSNLFHKFSYGGGVDSVGVSLLCAGVTMTGPGTIYRVHFHASSTVQATTLSIMDGSYFANAGITVLGMAATDAAVGIGMTPVLDAGEGPPPAGISLSAAPNPARGEVAFAFGGPLAADAQLRVTDAQGRAVRVLAVPAGARSARWDARSAGGGTVRPGLYLVELRRGERRDMVRVAVVR
jgi:hypothetical protein